MLELFKSVIITLLLLSLLIGFFIGFLVIHVKFNIPIWVLTLLCFYFILFVNIVHTIRNLK